MKTIKLNTEFTKKDWKELCDALNKQGKPKHPFADLNLQQKEMLDKAIREDYERQFGKPLKDNNLK